MRVVIADPPAYTPWYDHELATALAAAGADVEVASTRFRFAELPPAATYRRSERFYPLSSRVPGRSRLRLPLRAAEHLAVLAWLGYGVTKPRTTVKVDEGTRVAPRDHLGRPVQHHAERALLGFMLDHQHHRAPEVRVAEQRRGNEQLTCPGGIHHVTILMQEPAPRMSQEPVPCLLPPASARTAAATSGATSAWKTEGMM